MGTSACFIGQIDFDNYTMFDMFELMEMLNNIEKEMACLFKVNDFVFYETNLNHLALYVFNGVREEVKFDCGMQDYLRITCVVEKNGIGGVLNKIDNYDDKFVVDTLTLNIEKLLIDIADCCVFYINKDFEQGEYCSLYEYAKIKNKKVFEIYEKDVKKHWLLKSMRGECEK